MANSFKGGCACGAVTYVSEAEPELTFFCHCRACQKESGGPFSVELVLARGAVSINGALDAYESVSDSGNKVTRKFCAICNSPILLETDGYPDIVCVKAGSLDDAAWVSPQYHIYTATKQPWVHISDDLPQYEGDSEQ